MKHFTIIIILFLNFYFLIQTQAGSITNQTQRLPEVLVETSTYEEAQKELWKMPGGVELITAPQIEKTRATNLKDVFQLTPGVYVQPRQGAADEATLSIRGSGIRNAFHLRGIR